MSGTAPSAPSAPTPVYYLCFVVLGLSLAMSGPALPHLRQQVDSSVAAGGLIVSSQMIGYIVASLTVGRFLDRGAGHPMMVTAGLVMAAAIGALQGASTLASMVAAFVVLGAAGGVVDVASNTLLVWSEPVGQAGSKLNALHLCFGIGAIASPLVVAASLAVRDDLWLVSATVAALVVMAGALFRTRAAPAPRQHAAPPAGEVAADRAHRRTRRTRVLATAAAFFALYVGAEATFASWVTTYGEDLDLGLASAPALLTAVFWAGFTLGRVAAVIATRTKPVEPILVGTCLGAAVAGGALWLADATSALVWVLTAGVGFLLGPQYATMLAAADQRARLDGASTSLLVGVAGMGGLAGPLLTGLILDAHGVDTMPLVVAGCILAAAGLAALTVAVPEVHETTPLPADRVRAVTKGDP
jgi:fucose permease